MKYTALGATGLVALLASTAAAELPNKNTDREGWIKASMTGKQAAFCGPAAPKELTGGADPDFVANQVAKQWDGVKPADADLDTALFLANALCKFPGNPDLQAKLTPIWQSFVTFYGLTGSADLADFVALATPGRTKIETPSKAPADTRFADADGRTQALIAKALLETAYGMDFMSYAEMLDTAAKPSEHLKVAFVEQCVDSYHGSIGRWAICQGDARGLDRKRFDAELAGPTIDPRDRLAAKLRFVKLQGAVAAAEAKWNALAAKDDGVVKVITTIPAEATKAFAEAAAAHPALLAWSYQLVDDARANNKKLLNGCDDTLRTHLTSYLTAKAPRTREELRDLFKDEIGSQLANAAAICFARNPAAQSFWSRWSTGYAERWGTRTAVWHALAAAKIEFDTDLGRDPIGLPKPVVLFANGTASTSSGTIAKLADDGDNLVVTFKKETWKEPVCKQWKETNRVDSIDWKSGELVYRSVCVKRGVEKRSSQATPVTVAKTYAGGLKVGTIATFVRNDDGTGYPIEVFADKKREKLVGAFGVTY
jgi:hypothetical protein